MEKRLGIITGSGVKDFNEIEKRRWKIIETPYGSHPVYMGYLEDRPVAWIPRFGVEEEMLTTMINPRAIIFALLEVGSSCIISTTGVGIIDKAIPLAHPILFDDLFFPANRLPDGSPCTFFTDPGERNGHFVFEKPMSSSLHQLVLDSAAASDIEIQKSGVLAQTLGPRMETASEIRFLQSVGASAVTMSAGYEMILAGELEVPYVSVGFGINYATGVMPWASVKDEMKANTLDIEPITKELITAVAENPDLDNIRFDTGYVMK